MFTPFDTSDIKRIAATTAKPEEVTKLLTSINKEYWALENEAEAERCRHRYAVNALRAKMQSLQHVCLHPESACEFYSDPYESGYSCNVCGADRVRPGRKKL